MKKLGGCLFVWNGISQDYNFRESMQCLLDLCDNVVVLAGGNDGTKSAVEELIHSNAIGHCELFEITYSDWNAQMGRQKLSYFQNVAMGILEANGCDWTVLLQADEIIYPRSFPVIREAIEHDVEAYVCKRYNAWRDPLSMLNVIQERKPCSTEVIRLAKSHCRSYDDGEHVASNSVHVFGREDAIEIYHAGYIRDPVKHVVKAKNMLVDIFGLGMDSRIGEVFDWSKFPFQGDDIVPIPGPLPVYIREWCADRYPHLRNQIMNYLPPISG